MDHSPRYQSSSASRSSAQAPTVVVGVDGSDPSWDAFWWAVGEARRLDGRVVATLVSPVAEANILMASAAITAAPFDYAALDQIATDRAEHLRNQLEGCAADHGVALTFVRARGDAATELLHVADEYHADLIVVGRSSKARHHLAGSLGKRLVGRGNAPVVVVVP